MNTKFTSLPKTFLKRDLFQFKQMHRGQSGKLTFASDSFGPVVRVPNRDLFISQEKVPAKWATIARMDGFELIAADTHKEMSFIDAELRSQDGKK